VIVPSGTSYSISINANINSNWTTSPPWKRVVGIIDIFKTSDPDSGAHANDVVIVKGCNKLPVGSLASGSEDGKYLRQPPYDNINDHPHYIKNQHETLGGGPRRHLFYDNGSWRISPVSRQCIF
jgi:hypothetical protein